MAKLKTHKGIAKRFKVTATGKFLYRASGWNHMKAKRDARIKYRKNAPRELSEDTARVLKKHYKG